MNTDDQLLAALTKMVVPRQKKNYWFAYQSKKIQRYLMHTLGAFLLQMVTIFHLAVTYPALPMYPPIGTAFILLHLLGTNAIAGLVGGGLCAYFLQGLPLTTVVLYVFADIGCGYLGVRIGRRVLSSDLSVFICPREWIAFITMNAFLICVFSSVLRLIALLIYVGEIQLNRLFYYWVNLWVSDLNAMLVFSGFLLSWISVYLGREKVVPKLFIDKTVCWGLGLTVVATIFWIKNPLVMISLFMAMALYLSYVYGLLIATVLVYLMSLLFLIYFMAHQQLYLQVWGLQGYTLVAIVLLFFVMAMFFIGQATSKNKQYCHFMVVS